MATNEVAEIVTSASTPYLRSDRGVCDGGSGQGPEQQMQSSFTLRQSDSFSSVASSNSLGLRRERLRKIYARRMQNIHQPKRSTWFERNGRESVGNNRHNVGGRYRRPQSYLERNQLSNDENNYDMGGNINDQYQIRNEKSEVNQNDANKHDIKRRSQQEVSGIDDTENLSNNPKEAASAGPAWVGDGPWVAYKDSRGREYYHNVKTNTTQWEKPPCMVATASQTHVHKSLPNGTYKEKEKHNTPGLVSRRNDGLDTQATSHLKTTLSTQDILNDINNLQKSRSEEDEQSFETDYHTMKDTRFSQRVENSSHNRDTSQNLSTQKCNGQSISLSTASSASNNDRKSSFNDKSSERKHWHKRVASSPPSMDIIALTATTASETVDDDTGTVNSNLPYHPNQPGVESSCSITVGDDEPRFGDRYSGVADETFGDSTAMNVDKQLGTISQEVGNLNQELTSETYNSNNNVVAAQINTSYSSPNLMESANIPFRRQLAFGRKQQFLDVSIMSMSEDESCLTSLTSDMQNKSREMSLFDNTSGDEEESLISLLENDENIEIDNNNIQNMSNNAYKNDTEDPEKELLTSNSGEDELETMRSRTLQYQELNCSADDSSADDQRSLPPLSGIGQSFKQGKNEGRKGDTPTDEIKSGKKRSKERRFISIFSSWNSVVSCGMKQSHRSN